MGRNMKKLLAMVLALMLISSDLAVVAETLATLTLPAALQIIEDEAFCGDTSIDKVVVPDGTTKIGSRAFANSSLSELVLPDSLTFIEKDAFEGCGDISLTVPENCYAYDRCVELGLINPLAFRATVVCSAGESYVGSSVVWTATAVNGLAPYKYLYKLYRNNSPIATRAYSEDPTYTYSFTETGDYHVVLSVKDDNREIVSDQSDVITVGLEKLVVSNLTCDLESIQTTETATWTAAATGGQAPYAFEFTLTKDGETVAEQAYSDEAAFSHEFVDEGNYTLAVKVRDDLGTESEACELAVPVALRPIEITSLTADVSAGETEEAITWTVEAFAGKAPYTYAFEILADGVSKGKSDEQTENTYSYTPELAGTYQVIAYATDAYGNVARLESSELAVTTKPLAVFTVTADKDWVKIGDTVTWTTTAIGGVKPLRYAFDVYVDGEELDGCAFTTKNTISYAPEMAGVYSVNALVRDAENTTVSVTGGEVRAYEQITVKSIAADVNECLTGEPVTWTANVTGGKGTLSYYFEVYCGDTLEYVTTGAKNTLLYAPMHSGTYTVKARATDENNEFSQLTGGKITVSLHESSPVEDFTFNTLNGTYCEITGYTGTDTAIVLPEADPEGRIVQNIANNAFKNKTALRSVVIPDCVETMGSNVFYGCTNLLTVIGGKKLTNVGSYAFYNCSNLKNYSFDDLTATLGDHAFYGCTSLQSFEGWDGLKTIGANAFSELVGLTSISLPDGLTTIKHGAFMYCSSLESIHLPDSITTLYDYVFYGCSKLASVNYPKNWTSKANLSSAYPESPFHNCASLKTIVVPEGVTEIPANAFYECSSLSNIELPSTLTKIGNNAFYGCSGFRTLDIPEGVTTIGSSAFEECTGMTSIVIPDGMSEIQNATFYECTGLTSISLPEGLTTIKHGAFMYCSSLESIHLPDSITTLYDYVFYGCSKLASVNYPKNWTSKANLSSAYPESPFHNCASLKTIVVPEGVTEIPANAFYECSSLSNIELPSTLTKIGNNAFYQCIGLSSIDFPDSITSMSSSAFYGCTGLTSVVVPDKVTVINSGLFSNCSGLRSVYLPEGITTIYNGSFAHCTALESIHLPDSVTTIYGLAFAYSNKLSSINYPMSWKTVSTYNYSYPFECCEKLTNIAVPEGITAIPANAFRGMTSLKSIDLPSTLASIGSSAFHGATALESIVIPEGTTTINASAFYGCSSLKSITIPESVTTIGSNAFYNCTGLSIYGVSGSYAETYAAENGFAFNPAPVPSVTLTVEATGETVGSSLNATAAGSSGTAPYTYSFSLYQDGELIRQTPYNSGNAYGFTLYESGTYQVTVTVRDHIGLTGSDYSGSYIIGEAEYTTLSGRVLDDAGNPVEGATVTIVQDAAEAQMLTAAEETEGTATVISGADGTWSWTKAIPGASYTVSFAKEGMTFNSILNTLIDSIWGIITSPVFALGQDITVASGDQAVSGIVTTADGAAVQGVSVTLTNAAGSIIASTVTDENGKWGIAASLAKDTYTVNYSQSLVSVEPASQVIEITDESPAALTAVASALTAETSDEVSFTMESSNVFVGYSANFTVNVPQDVTKARMVVDGVPYDVIYPVDGACNFYRVFNKSGQRSICFQIARNGEWTVTSEAQTLNVISNGELEKPVFNDIASHYTGTALSVDWQDIQYAQKYTVRVYYNGVAIDELITTESCIDIPAKDFPYKGQYGVSVMATGRGYSQSETADLFDVVLRDYKFKMKSPYENAPYVVGDQVEIQIEQSGGGYIAVKVEEPSGRITWYPKNEAGVAGEEAIYLPVPVTATGTHTITPYLFSVDTLTEGLEPVMTGKSVHVSVNGPSVRGIYPGGTGGNWIYASSANQVRVATNNSVENVEIYKGSTLLGSNYGNYTENATTFTRTFNVNLNTTLAKGKQTITVKVIDADTNASASLADTFYVVSPLSDGSVVYPQANTIDVFDSPHKGKKVMTVNGGSTIDALTITGDAATWYQVKTADGTTGFVQYSDVNGTAWEGATGEIVITCPLPGIKLPLWPTHELLFSWETGLVVPEGSEYKLILDGLVSGIHMEKAASESETTIAMGKLKDDEYTVTVKLVQNGSTIAASAPLTFTLGEFTLEDSYRQWWLDRIAPHCSKYLKKGEPFTDSVSVFYGWHGFIDTEINAAIRPQIIFEPATLAYTQILQDFKDLDKDSRSNANNNYALTSIDPVALRHSMLLSISKAMLEEKERGNLVLKADLSNVDAVAQSNQTKVIHKATADLVFNTIDAVSLAAKNVLSTAALTAKPAPGAEDTKEMIGGLIDMFGSIMDIVESTTVSYLDEVDTMRLLTAYADSYAEMVSHACDEYVDCLEASYLDSNQEITGGTYSSYVKEYINAFRTHQNNPDELYNTAVRQITNGTGYTYEQLQKMQQNHLNQLSSVLDQHMLVEIFVLAVNTASNAIIEVQLLDWDYEKKELKWINLDLLTVESLTRIKSYMTEKTFANAIAENTRLQLEEGIQLPKDHKEITETFKKQELATVEKWGGILRTALDIVHDSFELGIALDEIGTATNTLVEQSNNKGIFDTYGLQLICSLKLRMDALYAGKNPIVDYDWNAVDIGQFSIEQLESYRKKLIAATCYDDSILINYRNMRTINDNNGNKFDYDLDWLPVSSIDSRRGDVEWYRSTFSAVPDAYKSLIQ